MFCFLSDPVSPLLLLLLHCMLSNSFSGFIPAMPEKKELLVELRTKLYVKLKLAPTASTNWHQSQQKFRFFSCFPTFYSTKSNKIIKPSFRIVFVNTGIFNEKSGTEISLVYTSLSSFWFIFYWLLSITDHFFTTNFLAQVIIFIVKKVSTEGEYLLSYSRWPPVRMASVTTSSFSWRAISHLLSSLVAFVPVVCSPVLALLSSTRLRNTHFIVVVVSVLATATRITHRRTNTKDGTVDLPIRHNTWCMGISKEK